MERRSFLKWATNGLGALFGAILGLPGLAYFLYPRNVPAPERGFKPVARLSELEVGVPKQATIRDVRTDAWTFHPNDVIGRVWLIRRDEKTVEAYTTVCPHLGCSINFLEKDRIFKCPCHNGTFDMDCQRVETPGVTNPAPRGMDKLRCEFDPNNPDLIRVEYKDFIQGRPDQVAKS